MVENAIHRNTFYQLTAVCTLHRCLSHDPRFLRLTDHRAKRIFQVQIEDGRQLM